MKECLACVCAALCICLLIHPSLSAGEGGTGYEKIKGTIVSMDRTGSKITLRDSLTNQERTIIVDAKLFPHLRAGATIEALLDRTNKAARGLKIIAPH